MISKCSVTLITGHVLLMQERSAVAILTCCCRLGTDTHLHMPLGAGGEGTDVTAVDGMKQRHHGAAVSQGAVLLQGASVAVPANVQQTYITTSYNYQTVIALDDFTHSLVLFLRRVKFSSELLVNIINNNTCFQQTRNTLAPPHHSHLLILLYEFISID